MGRKLPGSDFLFGLRIIRPMASDHRIVAAVDKNVVEGMEDRGKKVGCRR